MTRTGTPSKKMKTASVCGALMPSYGPAWVGDRDGHSRIVIRDM